MTVVALALHAHAQGVQYDGPTFLVLYLLNRFPPLEPFCNLTPPGHDLTPVCETPVPGVKMMLVGRQNQ